MSPPEYLSTCIPRPYTVLGMKLRPLSIGHILLMQWQGLSYVQKAEKKPATMDDLISGSLICSMRFREYQKFLQREDLADVLKEKGRVFDLGTLPEKQKLFTAYLNEGTDSPEVEIPDRVTRSVLLGTPWLQSLRLCLMTNLHVTSEDAFDYPYRLALWDCFSLRESEGRLVINSGQTDTAEMQEKIETLQALNLAFAEMLGGIPKRS
jgi:hypothetical protein